MIIELNVVIQMKKVRTLQNEYKRTIMRTNAKSIMRIGLVLFIFLVSSSMTAQSKQEASCVKVLSGGVPGQEKAFKGYMRCLSVMENSLSEVKKNNGTIKKLETQLKTDEKTLAKVAKEKKDEEVEDKETVALASGIKKAKAEISKLQRRNKLIQSKNISVLKKSYDMLITHYESENDMEKVAKYDEKLNRLKQRNK